MAAPDQPPAPVQAYTLPSPPPEAQPTLPAAAPTPPERPVIQQRGSAGAAPAVPFIPLRPSRDTRAETAAQPPASSRAAMAPDRAPPDPATETAPEPAPGNAPEPAPAPPEAAAPDTSAEVPETAAASGGAPDPIPPAPEAEATPAAATPAATASPGFMHRLRGTQAPAQRWPELAAITALALLLVLQLLIADRARLAADPQWRPLLVNLCGVLRCSLPAWREPERVTLLQRQVRPHPSLPGVLRVDATLRNDARWAQALPELVLTLSDVDGRPLGTRAFQPGEYLADGAGAQLDSGAQVMAHMDIVEPSPNAVAFTFEFR